jgi:epoxyqueuosine reductase
MTGCPVRTAGSLFPSSFVFRNRRSFAVSGRIWIGFGRLETNIVRNGGGYVRGDLLAEFARENGIDAVGVTPAEPFPRDKEIIAERLAQGLLTPFSAGDAEKRCDPGRILPGARSIITVAVRYSAVAVAEKEAQPTGKIARYARGIDYHRHLGEKLSGLADFLRRELKADAENVIVVDNGPLVERSAAVRSGLGRWGENCSVTVPGYGSWVSLGEVITTAELAPGAPGNTGDGGCNECGACRRACPTGALAAPYLTIDRRCLSYISQTKGFMPREYRRYLGQRLWGCDACQEACPVNQNGPAAVAARPDGGLGAEIALLPLLNLSNREFRAAFGETAIAWRGRETVQRNALVVLGNTGDPASVPAVTAALLDARPVIRGHAAWALGRLGGRESRAALEKAMAREADGRVTAEIHAALAGDG